MATEKLVLETIKFDLVVDLPYNHLLKFIKLIKGLTVCSSAPLSSACCSHA